MTNPQEDVSIPPKSPKKNYGVYDRRMWVLGYIAVQGERHLLPMVRKMSKRNRDKETGAPLDTAALVADLHELRSELLGKVAAIDDSLRHPNALPKRAPKNRQ